MTAPNEITKSQNLQHSYDVRDSDTKTFKGFIDRIPGQPGRWVLKTSRGSISSEDYTEILKAAKAL